MKTISAPRRCPAHSADCHHRHRVPAGRHRCGKGALPRAGGRESHREGRQAGGITAHWPDVQRSEVLLEPSVSHQPTTLQRPLVRRLESGAAQPRAHRCGQGAHRGPAGGRSGQPRPRSGGSRDRLGKRSRPGYQSRGSLLPGGPHRPPEAPEPGPGPRSDRGPRPGAMARSARRAPGQRAGAEPGAR